MEESVVGYQEFILYLRKIFEDSHDNDEILKRIKLELDKKYAKIMKKRVDKRVLMYYI